MKIHVEIEGKPAYVQKSIWYCEDEILEERLNILQERIQPSAWVPDVDYASAVAVTEKMHGEIKTKPAKSKKGKTPLVIY